jgi:hypothetical protein
MRTVRTARPAERGHPLAAVLAHHNRGDDHQGDCEAEQLPPEDIVHGSPVHRFFN